MATKLTSENQFDQILQNNPVVVIDFTAKWCGPCKRIAPLFDDLARDNEGVACVKVDVDQHPEIAGDYNVRAMPTFVVVKNGREVNRMEGADESKLTRLVEKYSS